MTTNGGHGRGRPKFDQIDKRRMLAAHDEHAHTIDRCPACNVQWAGRTVGDGGRLIAQHMTRCMEMR